MLEQIAAKDPEAIGALYRYLYAEVLPGFRKQVRRHGGKRELADDLFQEAFLTVIKKIQETGFEANSPQKLSAYVAGISKNLFIGSRRRKAHRMRVDGDPLDHQSNTHSVEEEWIEQEKAEGIQLQIHRLGKICQDILIRFFYEEKSHQEIAAELGKTAKSIRNQQYRCMKKLRAACEDMFDLLT
ncbi:MAG: sigma-70 family RNA polymerase sigma factor [Bacteroidota bacterium]